MEQGSTRAACTRHYFMAPKIPCQDTFCSILCSALHGGVTNPASAKVDRQKAISLSTRPPDLITAFGTTRSFFRRTIRTI